MIVARPKLNRSIFGGLPLVHADKYRPSDKLIDDFFIYGKLGDLLELALEVPSVLSGLVVTDSGTNSFNISAGVLIGVYNQTPSVTPHNYDGAALTPQTIDPSYAVVPYAGATGVAFTSGAGTKYVKAKIVDGTVLTRGYATNPASTYPFLVKEGIQITINNTPPTSDEHVLATFTENASPFTLNTTTRIPDTTFNFPSNRIRQNIFTSGTVAANKICRVTGRDSGTGLPIVAPVTDLAQTPIGILERSVTGSGRIATYGPVQVAGFTGVLAGNKVYCTSTGDLTTADTGLPVGYQLTTGANAWVFFDFGGGGGGGGSGTAIQIPVNQAAHGFVVGNPIYLNGSTWAKALADDVDSVGVALVSEVVDANNFKYTPYGKVTLTTGQWDALTGLTGGLVAGTVYRTSSTVAGNLVSVPPAVDNPIIIAISTTEALVQPGFVAAESGAGNTVVSASSVTTGSAAQVVPVGYSLSGNDYVFVFVGGALLNPSEYSISGTNVTITAAWSAGQEIHIRAFIATAFNNDLTQFMARTTVVLADDAQANVESIFPTDAAGYYQVFEQGAAHANYVKFYYTPGSPPDISIETSSVDFETSDIDGNLCLHISGSDLFLKNRLGSSKTFIVWRQI